jgi:hypothetical protein
MNIINYCKYINKEQINNVIKLLPLDYRKLNVNIILLSNKWQIFKYINTPDIWIKIKKIILHKPYDISGTCDNNYIFVCTYQFDMRYDSEYRELSILQCIQTLIHEIRHQYQKEYMLDEYKKYTINKEYQNNTEHDDRWEEKDAYKFASDFMNANYEKIMNIIK